MTRLGRIMLEELQGRHIPALKVLDRQPNDRRFAGVFCEPRGCGKGDEMTGFCSPHGKAKSGRAV